MSDCKKLNSEQRQFCHIRFNNPNISGAECVFRAYPDRFSSVASASAFASRLLKKDKVIDYLDKLSRRVENRIGVAIGRVLKEEAILAFYDPGEMIDPVTRDLRPVDKLPEHLRRAISSFKVIQTTSIRDPELLRTEYRYKFQDKGRALERIERYLGMFLKDNEQKPVEKTTEKWVPIPVGKNLTLAQWSEQVAEMNRIEEANAKRLLSQGNAQN